MSQFAPDVDVLFEAEIGEVSHFQRGFDFVVNFVNERVGRMHGGERREALGDKLRRVMMQSDGFNNVERKIPGGEKFRADFGMGRAEFFDFLLPGGGPFFARGFLHLQIVVRKIHGEEKFAEIMEKAGEKSFVAEFGAFVLGDLLRERGDAHGVGPKFFESETAAFGFVEIAESVREENERARHFEAEILHGLMNGGDAGTKAERGGVGELQELRGDGEILEN